MKQRWIRLFCAVLHRAVLPRAGGFASVGGDLTPMGADCDELSYKALNSVDTPCGIAKLFGIANMGIANMRVSIDIVPPELLYARITLPGVCAGFHHPAAVPHSWPRHLGFDNHFPGLDPTSS